MTALPPLLAIAEGRKVRARKAPVLRPRESKLQVAVADLLRAHCLWEWTHINRTAKDARQGAMFRELGVNRGWGDFILLSPDGGRAHFLELKRIGKNIDDDQVEFRLRCIKRGTPYVVARTIDDVGAACDVWGCLRITFASARIAREAE
jgi:hypothetical protein